MRPKRLRVASKLPSLIKLRQTLKGDSLVLFSCESQDEGLMIDSLGDLTYRTGSEDTRGQTAAFVNDSGANALKMERFFSRSISVETPPHGLEKHPWIMLLSEPEQLLGIPANISATSRLERDLWIANNAT
jgi:hypothetical protein